ncbi:MAG TPA: YfhO family protein [bacterium]|nr:YfhO family protein [bacterium]
MRSQDGKKFILALLSLTILLVVFFHEPLFGKKLFYYGDLSGYFFPYLQYFHQHLDQGFFAQWCHLDGIGSSVLTNPQFGAFYPLNFPFFFLPALTAFQWVLVLHTLLAALGCLLLLRGLGLSWTAALAGAISYGFSGAMLSLQNTMDYFEAACWLPFFLHFVLTILWRRRTWVQVAGGAVSYAMLVITSAQYALLAGLLAGCIAVGTLLGDRRNGSWRQRSGAMGMVVGVGLLGLAIAAAQWLPTTMGMSESMHAEAISLKESTRVSFRPIGLINFFIPNLFYYFDGTTAIVRQQLFAGTRPNWLLDVYPGLFALFFAMIGLGAAPRRQRWLWGGTALVSLLLAFGKYLPVYPLFFQAMPFFKHFRYPEKFLLLTTISLCVLAGFGLQSVISDPARARRGLWIAAAPALALVALAAWQSVALGEFVSFFAKTLFDLDTKAMTTVDIIRLSNDLAQPVKRLMIDAVFLAGFSALIYLALKQRRWAQAAGVLICLLAVGDLYLANRFLCPTITPQFYAQTPEAAAYIEPDPLGARYYQVQNWTKHINKFTNWPNRSYEEARLNLHWEELVPNYGLLHGMDSIFPISVLKTDDLYKFEKAYLADKRPSRFATLDVLDVRYLLSTETLDEPAWEKIADLKMSSQQLYENHRRFGRAYLRSDVVLADDGQQAREMLLSGAIDPAKTVVWERQAGESELPLDAADGTVRFVSHSPNEVVLDVQSDAPAVLVLAEAFAKDWRCTIDGQPSTIRRAYGLLRSTQVPAGEHRVVFRYRQSGLTAGIAISAIGWLLCIGLLWHDRRQSKRETT